MNKLFDIRTTVNAKWKYGEIVEVVITTTKDTRSKIWKIIVKDDYNPGVVQYGIKGDTPTTIILRPYPGYEGTGKVAQMAYAAACLAQVEDFTLLFNDPMANGPAALENLPVVNFEIDEAIIYKFQKLYVSYMAVRTLEKTVEELGGLNYGAICAWYDEAIEALRRLKFADSSCFVDANDRQHRIHHVFIFVDRVSLIKATAQTIHSHRAEFNRHLKDKIKVFEAATKEKSLTPELVEKYFRLHGALEKQAQIIQQDLDNFAESWSQIQENMKEIRRNTPPEPAPE